MAGVVTLVLWVLPWFAFLAVPMQWLNTHLHEFCHAVMAVLTGGPVLNIIVHADGNGVAIAGGSPLLVSSAGYVGASIVGALTIICSRTEAGASASMRIIGGLLAASLIFWVRGDAVGIASGIGWAILLFALPHVLRGRSLVFAAQFVGMQQCLMSVQALYILLHISAIPGAHSDADNLQQATGVPAIIWALLWSALGIGSLVLALKLAWRRERES